MRTPPPPSTEDEAEAAAAVIAGIGGPMRSNNVDQALRMEGFALLGVCGNIVDLVPSPRLQRAYSY